MIANYRLINRKFADIGQTVALQYGKGVHRISSWSHIVNAHLVSGPGVLEGLRSAVQQVLPQLIAIQSLQSQLIDICGMNDIS